MADLVAIYGSPRRRGNTSTLLQEAVQGAREAGAEVREFVLRDLKISPCLELYHCKKDGECSIKDDFQLVRDAILEAKGLILASPIFFYSVTAQTKILMDRFQSLWVKKYLLDKTAFGDWTPSRQGLFISAGATKGKRLFEGTLLTVKYFFDPLDMALWDSLLYRGLDEPKDVLDHPDYLEQARRSGRELVQTL
ncbi:flavodoxin family protein [Desulfovermiculus halophilus]|uniref:flavodoxin family protein n=1 Tax=Desulfovermiculus halophilus TaxID=339722 RepID=UPI00048152C4|nr:flavodoxin family protein [Desulfovermiculus halophilus]